MLMLDLTVGVRHRLNTAYRCYHNWQFQWQRKVGTYRLVKIQHCVDHSTQQNSCQPLLIRLRKRFSRFSAFVLRFDYVNTNTTLSRVAMSIMIIHFFQVYFKSCSTTKLHSFNAFTYISIWANMMHVLTFMCLVVLLFKKCI